LQHGSSVKTFAKCHTLILNSLRKLEPNIPTITNTSFSEGNEFVSIGDGIKLWNLQTGTIISENSISNYQLCCATVSISDGLIWTGSSAGLIQAWNKHGLTIEFELKVSDEKITSINTTVDKKINNYIWVFWNSYGL